MELSCRPNNSNHSNNQGHTDNVFEPYTFGSVINISDVTLTDTEMSLLSRGLNFCPTPGEPDFSEIKQDLDKFHTSLRRKAFFGSPQYSEAEDPPELGGLLLIPADREDEAFDHQNFKLRSNFSPPGPRCLENFISANEHDLSKVPIRAPHKRNMAQGEYTAAERLKCNPHIIIKPADKGSAVVVMNRSDYIREAEKQLSDKRFYQETREDLTPTHRNLIIKEIQKLYDNFQIGDKCKDYLLDGGERTAQFYLLPKVHKNILPPPGRPILSANDCPTEKISALVDHFLKPLVQKVPSYVKDTTHFLNIISDIDNLDGNCHIVTLDVGSLYTNIPHSEGLQAVAKFLQEHRTGPLIPGNHHLLNLLRLVLSKNNFDFVDKHYLQVGGTAMGTRVAPSYANLFMADFETKHVYGRDPGVILWLRFIDDIFCIYRGTIDDLVQFTNYLNQCHNSIKFSVVFGRENISFLDTSVSIHNGQLVTDLYTKPTDSHNYLLYSSAHPQHTKDGLPRCQFLRVRRICTFKSDFDKNSVMIARHFLRRGYPEKLVIDSLLEVRKLDRDTLLAPKPQPSEPKDWNKTFMVTTFNPAMTKHKAIIMHNWPLLGAAQSLRETFVAQPIFGHRRCQNVKDMVVRAKVAPIEPEGSSGPQVCSTKNCKHCAVLDTSGKICSTTTGRHYQTRINVTCKSGNLIYCLTCNICKYQYVGQTKRRLIDRLQEHRRYVKNRNLDTATGRHFTLPGHTQEPDFKVHILDFIYRHPCSPASKRLRNLIENKWIHRLRTVIPDGINTLD